MHKPAFRWQRKSLFLLGNGVSHQKLKMPHMLQDMLQPGAFDFATRWNITGEFFLSEGIRSCSQDEGKQGFQNICIFPQKDWPRQDSNLQSPVPKSGALSIRPHGLIPVECSSLTHRKYIKQMGLQYTDGCGNPGLVFSFLEREFLIRSCRCLIYCKICCKPLIICF